MNRGTLVDPTESGLETVGRRVGWGAAAAAVCALGCAAGLAVSRQIPWGVPDRAPVLDDGVGIMTLVLAVAGGTIGLVVGTLVGLVLGPRRFVPLLVRGSAGAVAGALAGGLGPILSLLTAGRLPAEAGAVLACGASGILAGFLGVPRPQRPVVAESSADEWSGGQERRPARRTAAGRLGPVLAVAVGCLAVVIVGPRSPAGWPMFGVALLGFAVAWALSSQEREIRVLRRRVRTLRRRHRERAEEPAESHR